MKTKFYSLLLLTLISTGIAATPRTQNTAILNGNWSSTATWSLGRIPKSNDSVVIPSGTTLIFNNSYTLSNVFITIGGTLNFNQNNTLALDAASEVEILAGGTLTATHPTPNELLTIAGTTKYDGKTDRTITGPNAATAYTGTSPAGFTQIVLPVHFASFAAARTSDAVRLTWNTGNEINNSHFEIERSTDGSEWETVGNVAAGDGASDSYMFADETAPAAQTQYRIRQVDIDGNYGFSKIVLVAGATTATAQATIIASGKTVSVFAANGSGNRIIVRVITLGGQVLQQQSFESAGRIDLNIATANTGIYVVQVTDGAQWQVAKKVML